MVHYKSRKSCQGVYACGCKCFLIDCIILHCNDVRDLHGEI